MSNTNSPKAKRLVICSSVTFYPELGAIKQQFERLGFEVVIPRMAQAYADAATAEEKKLFLSAETVTPETKRGFIEKYFLQIEQGDIILAYNKPKHNIVGYIGPNVLMELTVGFYLKKQLFVWQSVSPKVHGAEELAAMGVISLNEDPESLLTFSSI